MTRLSRKSALLPVLAAGTVAAIALSGGIAPVPAQAQDFAEFSRSRDALRAQSNSQLRARARQNAGRGSNAMGRVLPVRPDRGPSALKPVALPLPEGPLTLVVSLERQRLSVYSKGRLAERTTVSTGTATDLTPSGIFAVIEKNERHFSNLYGGAPMPFMQRLTMSGVALHSGHVTGRPASHGCIRLPHEYARRLFKATQLGVRVIVSADEPEPVDIANMRLLEPARIAAATRVATAQTTDIATASVPGTLTDSSPPPPATAQTAARDASIDPRTGRPKGPMALQRDEVLRAAPVSILVSRAEGRVYVRHMFEPQIDAPLSIAEPRRPLGTHVYTLTEMQPDGSGQIWSAITVKLVPRRTAAVRLLAGKRIRARASEQPRTGPPDEGAPSTASEAIERFQLPSEIVAQIAPLLRPGASLVVTDLAPSRRIQTGWTDIIVTP